MLLTLTLSVACAGAGLGEPVASFPDPGTRYFIQTARGLFDSEGRYLADLPGNRAFQVIDASLPATFVRSRDQVVRVAHREGSTWRVYALPGSGYVADLIGSNAVIETDPKKTGVVQDAFGRTIENDVGSSFTMDRAPAEYWWTPLPTPALRAFTGSGAGILGPDGHWVAPPHNEIAYELPTELVFEMLDGHAYLGPHGNPAEIPSWVDATGNIVTVPLPPDHTLVSPYLVDGEVWVTGPIPEQRVSLIDTQGQVRVTFPKGTEIDPTFPMPYRFRDGRAGVAADYHGFRFGYIDRAGEWVVGPHTCNSHLFPAPYHDGRAFDCEHDKLWLVDLDGKRIAGPWTLPDTSGALDTNGYGLRPFFSGGYAAVPVDGGWGYIDTEGRAVLPGPYDLAWPVRLGIAQVKIGEDIRYFRMDGTPTLVPP